MTTAPPYPNGDWLVSVPLSDLLALQNSVNENKQLREQIKQLNSRIDGLHRTQYELMEIVAEFRRSFSKPVGRSA